MGTSAAMSILLKASSAAGGVSVVDNKNEANVSILGDIVSGTKTEPTGDITLKSTLTQNLSEDSLDRLTAQSVAGAVSGYNSNFSVGAAVSVIRSNAETTVQIGEGESDTRNRTIIGRNIGIEAVDQSRLSARAGGVSISMGSSIGAGLGVSLIKSSNDVSAIIGKNTSIYGASFTLNAEKKEVTMDDYKNLLDMRSGDNELVKYTQKDEEGKEFNANVNLYADKILSLYDGINKYSFQNNYAEAIGASAGLTHGSASVGGSAAVVLTENNVKAQLGENVKLSIVEKGNVTKGDIAITATDRATNRLISGGLSIAPTSASVGAAVTLMRNTDKATASIGRNAVVEAGGSIASESAVEDRIQAFTVGVSMAISVPTDKKDKNGKPVIGDDGKTEKVGGSSAKAGAVNFIMNKAVATTETGDNVSIRSLGRTALDSKTDNDMMALAANGTITVGYQGSAAGASLNIIFDRTQANTAVGKANTVSGSSVAIGSDADSQLITGVASQAAQATGDGKAIAAAVNVNFSGAEANTTFAKDDAKATEIRSLNGDVDIHANTDAWALSAAASLPGGYGTAFGGSVNVNFFDRAAKVTAPNVQVDASGNARIEAVGKDISYMIGILLEGSVIGSAIGGNATYMTEDNDFQVILSDNSKVIADNNAVIESYLSDFTAAAVGSIALANAAPVVGLTGITINKTNTVHTDLGNTTVTAYRLGGDSLTNRMGEDVHGIYVGANAEETQYAGAAGIALSGGFNLTAQAVALVNRNTVTADASRATLLNVTD